MTEHVDPRWDTADGLRLRRTASDAGLSGRALATRIGVDKNTVSAWMRGKGNPTVDSLRRMADELAVHDYQLLQDEPPSAVSVSPNDAPAGGPARDAAERAADLLDRLDSIRGDLAAVPDLLAALDSAQVAAAALRRAFS